MRIVDITQVGTGYKYQWPKEVETYPKWIDYRAVAEDGEHVIRIGATTRHTYGRERARVTVWVDGYPYAEFLGADDFDSSGEVLSEIRVRSGEAKHTCCYPTEPVPARYAAFPLVGLPTRIHGLNVHQAWAAVVNIADHKTMAALAALRRRERAR
jgi:hypothetical protein